VLSVSGFLSIATYHPILPNPQAPTGNYRARRGSSPPDSRDNPERFPLALQALRNGRSSAVSTRRDPGLASRSPVSIVCSELASFGKIKATRARVTFRNRKLASFGKIQARPGKTPDPFYLNHYLLRLCNTMTNARSSRETGDLRLDLAAKCHSVDRGLRTRISTGNPPESDNALTRLTIPDGSSFARLEGRERFVLGRPMEGRWQPAATRPGIADCHRPHETRVCNPTENRSRTAIPNLSANLEAHGVIWQTDVVFKIAGTVPTRPLRP
jgi:hypothetical protein